MPRAAGLLLGAAIHRSKALGSGGWVPALIGMQRWASMRSAWAAMPPTGQKGDASITLGAHPQAPRPEIPGVGTGLVSHGGCSSDMSSVHAFKSNVQARSLKPASATL